MAGLSVAMNRSSVATRSAAAAVVALALLGSCLQASAQMQLHAPSAAPAAGAAIPHASGGGSPPGGEAPYVPAKPVVIKAPRDDTVLDHPLSLDGTKGQLTFARAGDDLVVSKLVFAGEKLSAPGTSCSVDVGASPPLAATPAGRPAGAIRYSVPLAACPFTVDVLDGAVLVSRPSPSCDFAAADCKVSPVGLWGPPAADITPKKSKELERERVRLEATMRANFRALLKRARKDKTAIKAIAREQAAFSSDREMTCRDYQAESVHGFCSTEVTEARVLSLLSKFGDETEDPAAKHHGSRAKAKGKPTAAPATVSSDAAGQR